MNRCRFVQNRVTDCNQQLVIPSAKLTAQWLIADLRYNTFANHLPELFLRDPVFLAVIANNQSRFFDVHIGNNLSISTAAILARHIT